MGAASIVAMRKQSNTNSSHSRGTAGAHKDFSLGGPRAREKERKGVSQHEKMRENKRHREGLVWDRDVENTGYYFLLKVKGSSAKKENQKGKKQARESSYSATHRFPLYPCNYGKSMHINI